MNSLNISISKLFLFIRCNTYSNCWVAVVVIVISLWFDISLRAVYFLREEVTSASIAGPGEAAAPGSCGLGATGAALEVASGSISGMVPGVVMISNTTSGVMIFTQFKVFKRASLGRKGQKRKSDFDTPLASYANICNEAVFSVNLADNAESRQNP